MPSPPLASRDLRPPSPPNLPPLEQAPDYLIELGAYAVGPDERWDDDEPISLVPPEHEAALHTFHLHGNW